MSSQITYRKFAFRHGKVFFVYMHSATVLAVSTTPVRGPEMKLESHSKIREEERTIPWSIEWPGVSPNITPVYQSVIKLSHCISGVRLSRSSAFHAARDRSLLLSHKQQDLVWCATSISLEWVMQQAAGESCKTYSSFRTESYDLGLLTPVGFPLHWLGHWTAMLFPWNCHCSLVIPGHQQITHSFMCWSSKHSAILEFLKYEGSSLISCELSTMGKLHADFKTFFAPK